MATKNKTKLIILTVALVIALAVSGTLMLFTAQSDTATNVVTLGNVSVKLQEKNSQAGNYLTVGVDDDPANPGTKFTGFDYGTATPGDAIEKYPRVFNDGNLPIYAFLKVELKLYDENGQQIAITKLNAQGKPDTDMQKYFGSDARFLDQNGDIDLLIVRNYWYNFLTNSFQNNASWFGLDPSQIVYAQDGTVTSGFFYANTNNGTSSGLTAIAKNTASDDLFTGITIPNDLPNAFGKVKFDLEITAYAVQADNNTYGSVNAGDTPAQKVVDMKKAFDGLTLY